MPKPVKVKGKRGRPPKDIVGVSASQKRVKKLKWNVTNSKMKLEDLLLENPGYYEIRKAEEDLQKAEEDLKKGAMKHAMNRKKAGLGVTGESSGVAKKQIAVVSPRVRLEEVFETEDDDDDTEEIEGTEMAGGDSTEEQIVLAINIKSVIMHLMLMLLLVCLWFLI